MRFLTRAFAVIGFLVVLGIAIGVIAAIYFHKSQPTMPDKAVLTLVIEGEFQEKPGFDPFETNHQMALGEAVKAIDAAADDKHIKGLFVDFAGNIPLTQAQSCAGRSRIFASIKNPPSPSPIRSASRTPAPGPITSLPPSTRSGCNRWAWSG